MVENKNKELIIQILAELVLDYMSIQNSKLFSYSEYFAWIIHNQAESKKAIFIQVVKWKIISNCRSLQE